jgi:hypothetical protein
MRLISGVYLVLLFITSCLGQQQPAPSVVADIKSYLEITDSQLAAIASINSDYNKVASEKAARVMQVQSELALETAKSPLDPTALGLRYAEIEVICRELGDKVKAANSKVRAVFADFQIARLKALEDAARLQSLIAQAQSANLLQSTSFAAQSYIYDLNGPGGIGGFIFGPSFPGCQVANQWFNSARFLLQPAGGAPQLSGRTALFPDRVQHSVDERNRIVTGELAR